MEKGRNLRDHLRSVAILVAAGVFLSLSGAFMGDRISLLQRLGYWLPVMLLGGAWGEVCSRLARRWLDLDDRLWLGGAVLTAIMALPLSVAIWAITGPLLGAPVYPLRWLPGFIVPVTAICAVMTAIGILVERRRSIETHAGPDTPPARFPDRLPPKLKGAALRAVEAEDHYLRVHTDRGSDLILMRMADALKELEGLEGAQTHRSWWVARGAVVSVSRGDGRAVLTLDGGLRVPVSRRHARALRAAGWW